MEIYNFCGQTFNFKLFINKPIFYYNEQICVICKFIYFIIAYLFLLFMVGI